MKKIEKLDKKFKIHSALNDKLNDFKDLSGIEYSEIICASLQFFLDSPPGIQEGIFRYYTDSIASMVFTPKKESDGNSSESPSDGVQDSAISLDFASDRQQFERVRKVLDLGSTLAESEEDTED